MRGCPRGQYVLGAVMIVTALRRSVSLLRSESKLHSKRAPHHEVPVLCGKDVKLMFIALLVIR